MQSIRVVIHLDLTLPLSSSSLPEDVSEQPICLLLGLAPNEACRAACVTADPVVSYTAVSPLLPYRCMGAVCFLLRYLSGRPGRTLSAIVLCGARKFLSTVKQYRNHKEVSVRPD